LRFAAFEFARVMTIHAIQRCPPGYGPVPRLSTKGGDPEVPTCIHYSRACAAIIAHRRVRVGVCWEK